MTKDLKDETGKRIHPYVPELCDQLRKGEVDRREFLRTVCLLGVSAGAAVMAVSMGLTGIAVCSSSGAKTEQAKTQTKINNRTGRIRLWTGIGDIGHASDSIKLISGYTPVQWAIQDGPAYLHFPPKRSVA